MNSINYVNAGCLMALPRSLPEQAREDILLSTLYLQLTSNKKFPDFKDFIPWNARYSEALRFLQYNAPGRVKCAFFSSSQSKSVSLEKIIRTGLTPLLSADELKSLDLLLQRASDLGPASEGLKVLTRHAVQQGEKIADEPSVNYIRIHAGLVDDASTVKMVTINLATRESIEAAFFNQDFVLGEMVGSVESERFTAQLDEDYAELRRNTVSTALAERGREEIKQLF